MIDWMQRHNRYLVWTIWIATIAFIGAGFVGWGTYKFGSKTSSIAKVGDVEISQQQLNMAYGNLYEQYNRMFGGKLDEAQAKKMGLVQQAFSRLENEALLLNLAKEIGLQVSDKELADEIAAIPAFQSNGVFDKKSYENYLRARGLSKQLFEETMRNNALVRKLLTMLHVDPYPYETKVVGAAVTIHDKIAYKSFSPDEMNVTVDEEALHSFWKEHKENFMSKERYTVEIVWTDTDDVNLSDEEIKRFYDENSFNYTDAKGKQLDFEDVKDLVERDLKIKRSKKKAQKSYIAFKKGKRKADETISLPYGDAKLSQALWKEIKAHQAGDIIKPKVVGNYYATVKIDKTVPPQPLSYEQAHDKVKALYMKQLQKEAAMKAAEQALKNLDASNPSHSDYLTLNDTTVKLPPLNSQETLQFLQKLFTSKEEKGMISVSDKIVVYKIEAQQFDNGADDNLSKQIAQSTKAIKSRSFESRLIDSLRERYSTEMYVRGLR